MSGNDEKFPKIACTKCQGYKFYNDMVPVKKRGFICYDGDKGYFGVVYSARPHRDAVIADVKYHLGVYTYKWTCATCGASLGHNWEEPAIHLTDYILNIIDTKIFTIDMEIQRFMPEGFERMGRLL